MIWTFGRWWRWGAGNLCFQRAHFGNLWKIRTLDKNAQDWVPPPQHTVGSYFPRVGCQKQRKPQSCDAEIFKVFFLYTCIVLKNSMMLVFTQTTFSVRFDTIFGRIARSPALISTWLERNLFADTRSHKFFLGEGEGGCGRKGRVKHCLLSQKISLKQHMPKWPAINWTPTASQHTSIFFFGAPPRHPIYIRDYWLESDDIDRIDIFCC